MGQTRRQNRIEELPNLSRKSHFLITGECVHPVPDMRGLRLIMVPVELLLCCFLLHAVDAFSYGNQTDVLVDLPSSLGSWLPSSDRLSCQTLLPKSLPGFTHMAPLPKFLISLPLMIALEKAGCQTDVWVLQLQLYRQGGVNATQMLIRHLQELEKSRSTGLGVSVDALVSALQLLAREHPGPERARRSLSTKDCEQEREQRVHSIVQLLPVVGTFYNLGTALYYTVQNCSEKAKERGRDGVIDLGFDLLTAMAGSSGGPTGIMISTALKPVLKAGVQRVIQYYNERHVNTPPPETSKQVLGGTSDLSHLEETTTMAPLVSEVVSSFPYGGKPYSVTTA
ncbi:apolipoprotein F [Hippopotamus amphibius kiboko]|uniref:apolipoprotein F n=1 Tax=Hippopotamus amphibius kiboko TaxID=575201 RepID=UPI00259699B7|nr:apolipoprotein F [Hippopotamus amphibius kiboko]